MARLVLACLLVGCQFSTSIGNGSDAPTVDAAIDAPAEAIGTEAMPQDTTMTFTSVADVYLRTSLAPDQNTNTVDFFIIDGDLIASGLVRFDLSAIPTSAVVTSAEMTLYCDLDPGMANSVYALLESWDEATVTSNQRAAGMTWMGAGATPPSRGTTEIGTFTPATANVAYTFALSTAVVQGWINTPATNFGVSIVTPNMDGSRFASRERAVASQRPALRITYQ